jgi:hypothetical protein
MQLIQPHLYATTGLMDQNLLDLIEKNKNYKLRGSKIIG